MGDRFQRAYQDTEGLMAWKRDLFIAFIAGCLCWLFLPEQKAVSEITAIVIAVVAAVLIFPLFEFGWNYLKAPERILLDQVAALETKVELFEPSQDGSKPDKHNVWLLDAIFYAGTKEWNAPSINIYNADGDLIDAVSSAMDEIRQRAYDGDLPIWGRNDFSGVLILIDKKYWERYRFDWFQVLIDKPDEFSTEHSKGVNDQPIYKNLRTSKSKVEELWQ